MNLKKLYLIIIAVSTILLTSCIGSNNPVELSGDASFMSLTFMRNDSIPGLDAARFSLEFDEVLNDSIIVNVDSLRFGIRIDSVFPIFQFRSSRNSEILQEKEPGLIDTIFLHGNVIGQINDTINFTFPTRVQNRSADGKNVRTYHIRVNVHQVEPNLYVWRKLNNQITSISASNQRAVYFDGRYLFYMGTDAGNSLFAANDTITAETDWQQRPLTFSPQPATSLRLRHIVENHGTLFVVDNASNLYSSIDGENWTYVHTDLPGGVYNLLFSVDNVLWAITRTNTNQYQLAFSSNGGEWTIWGALPERDVRRFPVSDFAVTVFKSPVGRPRILVVGGFDRNGQLVRASWIGQINTNNEMVFEPMRVDAHEPLHSASVIQYDNRLLLFGGMGVYGNIIGLLESRNEGLSWTVPVEYFNRLPDDFVARASQSVLTDKSGRRIFLIGGRNVATSYSDVWTVKLNRLHWAK